MAKIIENKKGFKVIEVSMVECFEWGGIGICDNCNEAIVPKGYYVAVLNRVLCDECYDEWNERAIYNHEDARIEQRNFEYYKRMLNL